MKRSIFFLLLTTTYGSETHNRILSGTQAENGQFPYMASLRSSSGSHFCGAAIITHRTLLSAAHCKGNKETHTMSVAVGSPSQNDTNIKQYDVEDFIIHNDFDSYTLFNDIALVITAKKIEFALLVQTIELASATPSVGDMVTACGWGWLDYPNNAISPNNLQWVELTVISNTVCEETIGDNDTDLVLEGKLCTLEKEGTGVCHGDSGGPIVNSKKELVGIVSGIYPCATGLPDTYINVFYYKDWIADNSEV